MPIPENQMPIGEGRHPNGKEGAAFFVDKRQLETLEEYGPSWKFDAAWFIEEAIQEPDAIFEGLLRHDQRDSLCYSVRPTSDPEQEYLQLPPKPGYVFLVFVQTGQGGFVVFDWEWREEDFDTPGHPAGWDHDYARRTWCKN